MKSEHFFEKNRNVSVNENVKTSDKIIRIVDEVEQMLLHKNQSYGDSATKPANIFAKGKASENICCRIDDKLMRIKNKGINTDTIDTVKDLIGYFVLLLIAIEDEN